MLCGCSKQKKPLGDPDITADSGYGLLKEIPECNGVEISDSWCPVLKCDHSMYPGGRQEQSMYPTGRQTKCISPSHNYAFDSGFDTGSSPDSGHSRSQSNAVKILDPYGSQPRLEISERGSSMDLSGKSSRIYQNYRGQIKLSVYLNSGLLTLHVRQAKHLTSKWSEKPCPYVKVSLYPANAQRTRCKTRTYLDTDRPQFDEKFSFEIGDEDFGRRLLVSVWSKDPNHNRSELLGCMSFGISNITQGKTTVHGWYFLLSENIGRRKHLQAHNKRHLVVNTDDWPCHLSETTSVSEFSFGPQQDIVPHSSVVHMCRGTNGYGFTLTGGCPSSVFTIEHGSPADTAGMRVGDSVLSINGQDVSRATADTVARIVRFHERIAIEVQSPSAPTPAPSTRWCSNITRAQAPRPRAAVFSSHNLTPLAELDLGATSSSSNSHTVPRHS